MTDTDIATKLLEAVEQLNHFWHVAAYRGLNVTLTPAVDAGRVFSEVNVTRPVFPHPK